MERAKRVLFVVVVSFLSACVSNPPSEPFHTRIYPGTYDRVWQMTLRAMNDYPLKISNKDNGRIQTEVVNGPYNDLLFAFPEPIDLPERYRYSLKLNLAKFVAEDGQPATRVRIIKELERFQDFYTGWLAASSDGVEEKVLLYRIDHLIRMEGHMSPEKD